MPAAAAGAFLLALRMGRSVRAQEELFAAGRNSAAQCFLVQGALGDGQAVVVRAHAADEQVVAVDAEMVSGDRGGEAVIAGFHVLHGVARGDVFEYYLEFGEVAPERGEDLVDEHRFAIEDIDLRRGHLAVDEQRHSDRLHAFQNPCDVGDVGTPAAEFVVAFAG